jgi:putative transposase
MMAQTKTMTEYRRFKHPGATWFFTVNLAERRGNRLLADRVDVLRMAFAHVKDKHPFEIDAVVILPDHLHCILTLPKGDPDLSTRWGLIKAYFCRRVKKGERISKSRIPAFMDMWHNGFIQKIGAMKSNYRILRQGNDANDAVRTHRILSEINPRRRL